MTVKTLTTWPGTKADIPTAVHEAQLAKLEEMYNAGKLATPDLNVIQESPKFIVNRYWTSTEAAEEWMAYIVSVGAESSVIDPTP